jgi:hypothetical protein
LTLASGSALIAAFALNDVAGQGTSSLVVDGNVNVESGATLLLGCLPTSFACLDDPSHDNPTLSSHDVITGSLTEGAPLGVVVHNTAIGGSVSETGGGGGVNCDPSGVFAAFGSPVYSDYEDSTIGGGLSVRGLASCWLGVARVRSNGSMGFFHVQLADPDGIEILANHIGENLACYDNSMVWDSADLTTNLYPRVAEPNTVEGARLGQCVLASARDAGGPLGPGPF